MVGWGCLSKAEHITRFHANQIFAHSYGGGGLRDRDGALLIGLGFDGAAQISARPDNLGAYALQSGSLELLINAARPLRPILRVRPEIICYLGKAADAA